MLISCFTAVSVICGPKIVIWVELYNYFVILVGSHEIRTQ